MACLDYCVNKGGLTYDRIITINIYVKKGAPIPAMSWTLGRQVIVCFVCA